MKKKSIISLLIGATMFGLGATSCQDMLSPSSERHQYEVAQDTLYSYWGILKSMQNIGERYVILGECRGELVDETSYITDSIKAILDFDMATAIDGSCRYLKASDYYHVINSCNAYIANCDTLRRTGTLQPYMLKEYAQVEAIRAWTYLQLVQVYGKVPFYTEPLTTTDKINSFMSDPNKKMVTVDNLADELAPYLTAMIPVENQYGFPQYEKYGFTKEVCHSTKCMIPLNIILGDLYLAKGDAASCQKAAEYYYNYLGNTQNTGKITPGGPLPDDYDFYGLKPEGADKTEYEMLGGYWPWDETGAVNKNRESITAIPSSTNKLWGTVLRGVNGVFGYDAEISVRTDENDTVTTASVTLTPQYDKKQLAASQAYFDLCNAQKFEIYIGAPNADLSDCVLTVDPNVGDARQHWVRDVRQTYPNGLTNTEKFITKQNPGGAFTTVYPMIYRKSMIWLRYAEALNRAGYPSYAFAILKNGLCNNEQWYPTTEAGDFAVRDSAYHYSYTETDTNGDEITKVFPEETDETVYGTQDAIIAALIANGIVADADAVVAENLTWEPVEYENWADESSRAVLNYLDRREVDRNPSFLNFKFLSFNAQSNSQIVLSRSSLNSRSLTFRGYSLPSGDDAITTGVHSRGCGSLKCDERQSVYNYVDCVAQKALENYGVTLTKEDIYNGVDDATVQNCVEDLIIDECALELAFEGTRFFDLMRVAHRRNDPSYLANRLAKRNPALGVRLLDKDAWYFPLPQN